MPDLTIETEDVTGGIRILRLAGPLTLSDLFEFQDKAREHTDSAILIDLSAVPYMDSAGLGAVLGLFVSCQRKGRGFGITGVTDRLRTLFKVAGVDGMIPTFDSVEIAGSKLSKGASR
jgi:anti-anti-sigma factor